MDALLDFMVLGMILLFAGGGVLIAEGMRALAYTAWGLAILCLAGVITITVYRDFQGPPKANLSKCETIGDAVNHRSIKYKSVTVYRCQDGMHVQ